MEVMRSSVAERDSTRNSRPGGQEGRVNFFREAKNGDSSGILERTGFMDRIYMIDMIRIRSSHLVHLVNPVYSLCSQFLSS